MCVLDLVLRIISGAFIKRLSKILLLMQPIAFNK